MCQNGGKKKTFLKKFIYSDKKDRVSFKPWRHTVSASGAMRLRWRDMDGRKGHYVHHIKLPFVCFYWVFTKNHGMFLWMSRSRVHLCVAAEDQARETATVAKKLEFCCFTPHGFKKKKPRCFFTEGTENAPSPVSLVFFIPLFTCDHTENSFRVVPRRPGVKYCR